MSSKKVSTETSFEESFENTIQNIALNSIFSSNSEKVILNSIDGNMANKAKFCSFATCKI